MTTVTLDDVLKAMQNIIDSIANDNKIHGGLVTRTTIRMCDEGRLMLSRYKQQGNKDEEPERTPD